MLPKSPFGPRQQGPDAGLVEVEDRRQVAIAHPLGPKQEELPVGKLDFLLASKSSGYWRLADGRIQKWRGAKMERDLAAYPWDATNTTVTCAAEDAAGNLIVGTHGAGIFWFDAGVASLPACASSRSTSSGTEAQSKEDIRAACSN